MDGITAKLSRIKQVGKLDQIRLYTEIIDMAPREKLYQYFDEQMALYQEYSCFDPKPPTEITNSIVQSLVKVFNFIKSSSDTVAFEKYEKVFNMLDKFVDQPVSRARIYQVFGYMNWLRNEIEASIRYLTESLRIVTESNITDVIPERYTNLGYVYEYMGNLKKAEEYYREGMIFAQQDNYEEALVLAYSGMGRLNLRLNKFDLAVQYIERNLEIIGNKEKSRERVINMTNLAKAYLSLQNYDKALELNMQLKKPWLKEVDPELYYSIISNIGSCYYAKSDFTNAKLYNQEAYNYAQPHADIPLFICSSINLGYISQQEQNLPEVVKYLEPALEHVEKTGNTRQRLEIYMALGKAYLRMRMYKKALQQMETTYNLARETGDHHARQEAAGLLAECYKKLGDFKLGYRYLAKYAKYLEAAQQKKAETDDEIRSKKLISSGEKKQYLFSDSMSLISRELNAKIGHWLIGTSKAMQEVVEKAFIAAKNETVNVMIHGESGTGKELVAKLIHYSGRQAAHPFMEVNSAVFTTSLAQSSLFGHKKGAFTGADEPHIGYIESAHQGTLFLDEISEMPAEIQSMMLRVLETKQIRPLGSNTDTKIDFRLICASNHDIRSLVEKREFRFDLFSRINTLEINLLPLRKRRDDIPLLINYFISSFSQEMLIKMPALTHKALEKLCRYDYPGNVRELKNIIQRLLLFNHNSTIDENDVVLDNDFNFSDSMDAGSLDLAKHEITLIKAALQRSGNVLTNAAKLLGISPFALARRLKKYSISEG